MRSGTGPSSGTIISTHPALLTEAEAASHLRICLRTLRKAQRRGEIEAVPAADGEIRYTAQACRAYLQLRRRLDRPLPRARSGPSARAIPA